MKLHLALTVLISACTAVAAEPRLWTFDDLPLDAPPPGWRSMTATTSGAPRVLGDGRPTVDFRVVLRDGVPGTGAGNRVVRVDTTKTSDYGAGHHLWTDAIAVRDGSIECLILAEDQLKGNGGLSFRVRDHRTFYAVRLQLSGEPGIMLFKVKDGNIVRTGAKASGTPVLGAGRWVRLAVTMTGANLRVAIDGKEYLNFTDANDPILDAGGVGLFARGHESIICWDNLRIIAP